jgi:hypothetical protein
MVQSVWTNVPLRLPSIILDAFQTMPNHIHEIIQKIKPVVSLQKISARYYYLTPSASPKLSARGPCNEDYYVGIVNILPCILLCNFFLKIICCFVKHLLLIRLIMWGTFKTGRIMIHPTGQLRMVRVLIHITCHISLPIKILHHCLH